MWPPPRDRKISQTRPNTEGVPSSEHCLQVNIGSNESSLGNMPGPKDNESHATRTPAQVPSGTVTKFRTNSNSSHERGKRADQTASESALPPVKSGFNPSSPPFRPNTSRFHFNAFAPEFIPQRNAPPTFMHQTSHDAANPHYVNAQIFVDVPNVPPLPEHTPTFLGPGLGFVPQASGPSMPSRSSVVLVPGVPPTPLNHSHQEKPMAPPQTGQARLRPSTTHLAGAAPRSEKPVRSYVAATQSPPPVPQPPQVPAKVISDTQQTNLSTTSSTVPDAPTKSGSKKTQNTPKKEAQPSEVPTKHQTEPKAPPPTEEKVAVPEVTSQAEVVTEQVAAKPRSTWAQRARAAKDVQPETVQPVKSTVASTPKTPQNKGGAPRADQEVQNLQQPESQAGRNKGKNAKRPGSRKREGTEKSQRQSAEKNPTNTQKGDSRKNDLSSREGNEEATSPTQTTIATVETIEPISKESAPIETGEKSAPVETSKKSAPIEAGRKSSAVETGKKPVPVETTKKSTPVETGKKPTKPTDKSSPNKGPEKVQECSSSIVCNDSPASKPSMVVHSKGADVARVVHPVEKKNNVAVKEAAAADTLIEKDTDTEVSGTVKDSRTEPKPISPMVKPLDPNADEEQETQPKSEQILNPPAATGLPTCNLGPRVGLSSKFASKEGGRIGSILDRFQGERLQSLDKPVERGIIPGVEHEPSVVRIPTPYEAAYAFDLVATKSGRKRYRMEDMLMVRQAPHCQVLKNRQDLPDWILSRRRGRPSSSDGMNGVNETSKQSGDGGRFGSTSTASHSGMLRKGFSTDFAASEATWSSGGAKPRTFGDKHHGGGGGGYGRSNTYADTEEWQRGGPHGKSGPPVPAAGSYEIPQLPEASWQVQQEKQKKNEADKSIKLMRRLRAQLNKMTPSTYNDIFEAIVEIGIETTDEAQEFVNLIFEKAITNHQYIDMYAELCAMLKSVLEGRGIFSVKGEKEEFNFRRMLLLCCQKAFEKHLENDFVAPPDVNKEEAFELLLIHKEKMKGNLMFVGCLAQNELVPSAVLMMIMRRLIESGKSLQLEALASFLPTVFETLDGSSRYSTSFNLFFEQVAAVSHDAAVDHRVQCLLKDVVEKFEAVQHKKMEEQNVANAANKSGSQRKSFAAVLGVRKNKV